MKTLEEYALGDLETIDCSLEDLFEDSTASSTTTGGVANPATPPSIFKRTKFLGSPCLEVDDETYSRCMQGKEPFKRWSKYVEDEATREEMKKLYKTNKRVLLKNSKTGGMVYIK